MTITTEQLVREIHARPVRIVCAATGGGSQAIADLLRIPGGSRTILEAIIPYSSQALDSFLHATPENYCSARTARAMAMASFERARELVALDLRSSTDVPRLPAELVGIGCTASLVSDRPKHGPHRIHVAVQTAAWTETASLELTKGKRDRAGEEQLASQMVLNAIAAAGNTPSRVTSPLLGGEHVDTKRTNAPSTWQALLLGATRVVDAFAMEGDVQEGVGQVSNLSMPAGQVGNLSHGRIVFPGAFDPLHDGHRRIAEIAEQTISAPMEFEISIQNVDKPPLDFTEIAARVSQFTPPRRLWLTRAPTFVEKSRLFSHSTFLAGADTIARIADPRYYGGDAARGAAVLREIAENGCRFLVYGRVVGDRFVTLESLCLPDELRTLCHAIPADVFRMDISSTELRRKGETEDSL